MARLTTQPVAAPGAYTATVPLRSGFYAVPFSLSTKSVAGTPLWVFIRNHPSEGGDGDKLEPEEAMNTSKLFATGLPYGTTVKSLKTTFAKLFPINKIEAAELIDNNTGTTSLYLQEIASASNTDVAPLLASSSTSANPIPAGSTSSAILTFRDRIVLPPTYPATPTWTTPALSSYLATASALYRLARPHLSTIIAHSDSWMTAFDARKVKATADALATSIITHEIIVPAKPTGKKEKNGKKTKSSVPLPGSAAHALAAHTSALALAADRTINPDDVVEENWTMVSRGGKHGKSLLPAGSKIGLQGYGGAKVGVARVRKLDEDKLDGEVKMIVGEGFYRFRKDERRRGGSLCPPAKACGHC